MTTSSRPCVSVLVPVHDAEATLADCLESVAGQSLPDIEVIGVDDGSTDGSLDILRRFQARDRRFRFARHERNRGEGAARNTALDHARGEFVFHLDADDLLPEHALERLWTVASEHGSQMVKGAYSTITVDGRLLDEGLQAPPEAIVNASLSTSGFFRRIPVSHCSYLYERSFLEAHGLRYRTDLQVGLDLVALTGCLVAANRVSAVRDVVYLYRQTDASASRGTTTAGIARDGIRTKRLVSVALDRAGHGDAAEHVLRTWDWQIPAFWAGLDPATPDEDLRLLFREFREVIPEGLAPWTENSPLAHRYLLALVLLGRDTAARGALDEIRQDLNFLESADLAGRLMNILEVAPDDERVRGMLRQR